jgi:hypothetical protein
VIQVGPREFEQHFEYLRRLLLVERPHGASAAVLGADEGSVRRDGGRWVGDGAQGLFDHWANRSLTVGSDRSNSWLRPGRLLGRP